MLIRNLVLIFKVRLVYLLFSCVCARALLDACNWSRALKNILNVVCALPQGRKALTKITRSTTIARNRHARGSPVTVYAPYSTTTNSNIVPDGNPRTGREEFAEHTFEEP